jgi:hypothetical protein
MGLILYVQYLSKYTLNAYFCAWGMLIELIFGFELFSLMMGCFGVGEMHGKRSGRKQSAAYFNLLTNNFRNDFKEPQMD